MGRDQTVLLLGALAVAGLAAGVATHAVHAGAAPAALAAAALAVAAAIAYHWRHAVGSQRPPAGVPVAPGALPLIGNAIGVLANLHRIHDWVVEQQRGPAGAGGRTFMFSAPFLRTFVCISNAAVVEHVLKTRFKNYVKGTPFRDNFGPLLGRGIFVADGEEWRWQRKLAAHIFSVKGFKHYVSEVFGAKADLLTRRLESACTASTSDACTAGPDPIDIHDLMYRFTLDTFARIGFGVDPGCLTAADKIPFAVAFDRAQRITNARFWVPCWRILEALNGNRLKLRQDIATVRSFAMSIITKRRQLIADFEAHRQISGDVVASDNASDSDDSSTPRHVAATAIATGIATGKNGTTTNKAGSPSSAAAAADVTKAGDTGDAEESPSDLLSLFMSETGPDGAPIGDDMLIDAVINFIIAGRDTTAQALSWTLFHVLSRPDVEERLLSEAADVLGPDAGGPKPTYDQIHALKYARAVFLEGLRLHPSVPENAKVALRSDTLPDGTRVPAGALIHYSAYGINRLQEFWGSDADEFRPERFLEFDHLPSPYSHISFHAGPRICLGQRLAELEGVYVLVMLLRRFKLSLVPGQTITYELSASHPMRDGMWVTVQERVSATA